MISTSLIRGGCWMWLPRSLLMLTSFKRTTSHLWRHQSYQRSSPLKYLLISSEASQCLNERIDEKVFACRRRDCVHKRRNGSRSCRRSTPMHYWMKKWRKTTSSPSRSHLWRQRPIRVHLNNPQLRWPQQNDLVVVEVIPAAVRRTLITHRLAPPHSPSTTSPHQVWISAWTTWQSMVLMAKRRS